MASPPFRKLDPLCSCVLSPDQLFSDKKGFGDREGAYDRSKPVSWQVGRSGTMVQLASHKML